MVKNKDMQFFYGEFENEQKKEREFEHPRFSVSFPPMIWIFMEGEGDKIKSEQASNRDRTLIVVVKLGSILLFYETLVPS